MWVGNNINTIYNNYINFLNSNYNLYFSIDESFFVWFLAGQKNTTFSTFQLFVCLLCSLFFVVYSADSCRWICNDFNEDTVVMAYNWIALNDRFLHGNLNEMIGGEQVDVLSIIAFKYRDGLVRRALPCWCVIQLSNYVGRFSTNLSRWKTILSTRLNAVIKLFSQNLSVHLWVFKMNAGLKYQIDPFNVVVVVWSPFLSFHSNRLVSGHIFWSQLPIPFKCGSPFDPIDGSEGWSATININ